MRWLSALWQRIPWHSSTRPSASLVLKAYCTRPLPSEITDRSWYLIIYSGSTLGYHCACRWAGYTVLTSKLQSVSMRFLWLWRYLIMVSNLLPKLGQSLPNSLKHICNWSLTCSLWAEIQHVSWGCLQPNVLQCMHAAPTMGISW